MEKEKHTLQFFDVASDDRCGSTLHAIWLCNELLLCQPQECTASNLLLSQNFKVFIVKLFRILVLKVLDELFRAPSFNVGDGRQLHGNDRASGCLGRAGRGDAWYFKWNVST